MGDDSEIIASSSPIFDRRSRISPVIPAKAGIQRVGDVVRAGVGQRLVHPRRANRAGYAHRNPDGVAVVSGVTTTTPLGERASANSKTSPPASAATTPTASATLSPKFNLALAVDMAPRRRLSHTLVY